MRSKRSMVPAGLAVVGLLALAACGGDDSASTSSSSAALTTMKVQLTFLPNVQVYGVTYAAASDVAAKYGTKIEWKPGAIGGLSPTQAVLAKAADIGVTSADAVVQAAAEGQKLVILGATFQNSPGAMTCRKDSGVTSVKDVVGHSIGQKQGDTGLPLFLGANDIKTDQVKVVPIGGSDLTTIIAGKVDCLFPSFGINEPFTIEKAGVPTNIFYTSENGLPAQSDVYVARPEDVAANPAKYANFMASQLDAWTSFLADPDAAAKWVLDQNIVAGAALDQQTSQAEAEVGLIKTDGTKLLYPDLTKLQGNVKQALDAGQIKSEIDVTSYVSTTVYDEAAKLAEAKGVVMAQ